MSFPTTLSPWYVVQREGSRGSIEYYTTGEMENSKRTFTDHKTQAMLFTNLQSAARVADAEAAQIRVLVTQEEAKEFGRG